VFIEFNTNSSLIWQFAGTAKLGSAVRVLQKLTADHV